jgi:short-subunit dehydrogenase
MGKAFVNLLTLFLLLQLTCFFTYAAKFCVRNFLVKERRLQQLYGPGTWVLVTGCGSGQGKRFAVEFAKRGFHVVLSGRASIQGTRAHIERKYPNVRVKCVEVDFCDAAKPDFFQPFEDVFAQVQARGESVSVVVNNIGHRVAWKPYHTMPVKLIHDSITCGTVVQSRLTQLALQHFVQRPTRYKSLIINVTANCFYSNFWFGKENHISLPYLSVYEAANAFGFYHSNSIEKEYRDIVDVLNIMPGAVVTENTQMLSGTPFRIDAKQYVKNVFKLMGNYTGPQFAHWGHELSALLCNVLPASVRDSILEDTAVKITDAFMDKQICKSDCK